MQCLALLGFFYFPLKIIAVHSEEVSSHAAEIKSRLHTALNNAKSNVQHTLYGAWIRRFNQLLAQRGLTWMVKYGFKIGHV